MPTTGFAAKDPTGLLVRTVADTERGAKVNWLYCYGRYMVTDAATDTQIAETFEHCRRQRPPGSLEIVPVRIEEDFH